MEETINKEVVSDYTDSIREVQEAIKETLGEKHASHPGVVGSIFQGIQLKRIADQMEMGDFFSEYEDQGNED